MWINYFSLCHINVKYLDASRGKFTQIQHTHIQKLV